MIAPVDHLIVKTELSEKNKIQHKGLTLDLQSYDHLKNAVTHGEVVATPRRLSKAIIGGRHDGFPKYVDPRGRPAEMFIHMDDIIPLVCEGDQAHFSYKICQEENFITQDEEGFLYYKCPYNLVYAVVRSETVTGFTGPEGLVETEAEFNRIIPIGSYCLLKPVMETESDILHPVPGLPKEKWIWTKPRPGRKYLTAKVEYLGWPFVSDPEIDLAIGDVVFLRKFADKEIEIEGETYYPVRMKDIEFKYLNGVSEFAT